VPRNRSRASDQVVVVLLVLTKHGRGVSVVDDQEAVEEFAL